ncbi:3766_t:CDS:1 [Paraglomus brasilianum]|uniref:3766_t:CDS:1 n=1 Tax=Paraglomus brasilianum TaxID=144538 RepID=A0A9N9F2Q8_9GLOM|nr:3766_t:CDS:1 [Paraglomus brasilianum]
MTTSDKAANLPILCVAQIVYELSESSRDLYSCLFVNRIWCRCAIVYLWKTPFYWSGSKSKRMLGKFLALLPKKTLDELTGSLGVDIPPQNMHPFFDYLSFVRTMKMQYCLTAVVRYLGKTELEECGHLLLLRLCREIVKHCPSLSEIDMTQLDYDEEYDEASDTTYDISYSLHEWPHEIWNIFTTERTNFNQLRRFEFGQMFRPDILNSAAEKLKKLDFFKIDGSDCTTLADANRWCDAISKLICQQEKLEAVSLSLDFQSHGISSKPVWQALYAQKNYLKKVKITCLSSFDILALLGHFTNLCYIKLKCCSLYPPYPLQLPSNAFSHLHTLKLCDVKINRYGFNAILGNLKESLTTLSIRQVCDMDQKYYAETWKACAMNTPKLVSLEVDVYLQNSITFMQTVLPLWRHLKDLSVFICKIHSSHQDDEIPVRILLALGINLPLSVKCLKVGINYQLSLEILTTFLSNYTENLEFFTLSINLYDNTYIDSLLEYTKIDLRDISFNDKLSFFIEIKNCFQDLKIS